MTAGPQLFRINVNGESRESNRMEEVDFARLGLRERRDIQEWIAANPGILGDDLLIVGKEFSGFDRNREARLAGCGCDPSLSLLRWITPRHLDFQTRSVVPTGDHPARND